MEWIGIAIKWLSVILVAVPSLISGFRIFRIPGFSRFFSGDSNVKLTEASPFNINNTESQYCFMQITALTLLNRAVIFLIAYLGFLSMKGHSVDFFASFSEIWARWDARDYLKIAEHWYQGSGEDRFLIVYYPLYPFAIRLVHYIIGNYFWAAIAVSLSALIAATYFFYRLIMIELADSGVARDAVRYMLIFPVSFFYSTAYTESLFLLLTVLTFYYCRRNCWFAASIAGMLAAMTRNQGVLLLAPLSIELFCRHQHAKMTVDKLVKHGACLLLVPLGLCVYLSINKWVTGDWFKFLEYQRVHWYGQFGFFADNLKNIFQNISGSDMKLTVGTWIPELAYFFVSLYFIISTVRKIPPAYIVYSVISLVISYSPTWLIAGPRYIGAIFPLYICMALFVRGHYIRQQLLDTTSYLLLGFYTIQYFINSNVF